MELPAALRIAIDMELKEVTSREVTMAARDLSERYRTPGGHYGPLLRSELDVKLGIVVMSFATMATFHASGYGAVLRAFEDNELNHLGFVLHKVVLLGLIFLFVKLHWSLIGFVVAHLLANSFLWGFYHLMVSRFYAKVPLNFDVPLWKELIRSALPLGSGVMLRQLALQLDILVLTWMSNLTTVGLFSGPYRISNVPAVTGAGTARVVLRDASGRETVTNLPFYVSSKLLAEGLFDFSLEAGMPRLFYATAADSYARQFVASASGRRKARLSLQCMKALQSRASRRMEFRAIGFLVPWGAVYPLCSPL